MAEGSQTDVRCVRTEQKVEGVAELVLCRPKRLNTMTPAFFQEFKQAVEAAVEDPKVNVILVRAEGRMFTAGLDLREASALMSSGTDDCPAVANYKVYKSVRELQQCFDILHSAPKPTIAAVHGLCIGGGVDLCCACDIRLCSTDAQFSVMETKIAIVADLGTLQRLTRIVGSGFAREMAFTGERFSASRCLQAGFVNQVFSDQEILVKEARALASKIAALSPLVVQGVKTVMNFSEEHDLQDSLDHVAMWNAAFLKSEDLVEAMTAFSMKRTPKFRNRL